MQSKWKVTSNLQHTCGVVKIFHGKQFDANTRYIEATIMDGDSAFTMPSNPKFMVGIRQADGTEMVYDAIITATPTLGLVVTVDTATYMSHGAINSTFTFDGTRWKRNGTVVDLSAWGITIVSGTPSNGNTIVIATTSAVTYSSNVVTFAVHPNLFLTAGDGYAELYICDGDEIISTFVYTVRVEKAAANPNNAVASTSFAVITAQIESYVNAWLTAHPEATTTVQDGSIGREKLTQDLVKELDNKANYDGSYDDMTVGNAKQVLGTVGVEDQTPYGFRTAGGAVDIGDRENVKAIVGGTIVWNQLIDKSKAGSGDFGGVTVTKNGDGSVTLNGANSSGANKALTVHASLPHVEGHKYLFLGYKKVGTNTGFMGYGGVKVDAGNGGIVSGPSVAMNIRIDIRPGDAFDNVTMCPIVIDLTRMFGSTIADYIYSLEQATAGVGVTWFKSLFPKDYYEYNAGELMSVKTSAHNMVGFNAYDPETGKAKVVGGNQYQITGSYTSLSLDGAIITPDTQGLFTPSTNGELIVMDGNATDTCIHLVWSGYRNGEYDEYALHSYPLDSDLELRGIPKLDANNKLYYDGDTYAPDGTVTRRYGIVDLGSLTWTKSTAEFRSSALSLPPLVPRYQSTSAASWTVCPYDVLPSSLSGGVGVHQGYQGIAINTDGKIWARLDGFADMTVNQFVDVMSGVYFVYELATPTTETAEPYQETQVVNDFGTEEYVDYAVEQGLRDVAIPVGSITEYLPNLRDKLQNAPNNPPGSGLWVVQRIDGANVYIPLATALQMINNGEDPTEEVEA